MKDFGKLETGPAERVMGAAVPARVLPALVFLVWAWLSNARNGFHVSHTKWRGVDCVGWDLGTSWGSIPLCRSKSNPGITGIFENLPTLAALAGAETSINRKIDGVNIWPQPSGEAAAKPVHDMFSYYEGLKLEAVREGEWKLMAPVNSSRSPGLYNLTTDSGETAGVTAEHPETFARLEKFFAAIRNDLGIAGPAPGTSLLDRSAHPRPTMNHLGRAGPGFVPES